MKKICLIHGPNINFTGIREKGVYGSLSYDEINDRILEKSAELGLETEIFQSTGRDTFGMETRSKAWRTNFVF